MVKCHKINILLCLEGDPNIQSYHLYTAAAQKNEPLHDCNTLYFQGYSQKI